MTTAAQAQRSRTVPAQWAGAVAFEWTKLASVRSSRFLLVIAVLATAGGAWLIGASVKASGDNGFDTAMPAPYIASQVLLVTQSLAVVVATLFITNEHSNGTIKTTLQAVPVRGRMLLSKALVIMVCSFVAGLLLTAVGTAVAAPAAGDYGTFTNSQLVDVILAGGIYLALLNCMVLGIGAALRNSAGTITGTFVLIYVVPQVLPIFDVGWLNDAVDYLPSVAATALATNSGAPYGWTIALGLLSGWAAAGLTAGYILLRNRDA